MSNSKNLGQVSGLYVGTSAPENRNLIWYDSTSSQRCHKVFSVLNNQWVALNPQVVSATTYSELVNNAKKNGLPIGKFYQITDKSDMLAVAITSTKVQYVDSLGNILVDDLGTNIQYHVSSDNLLIDDLNGVFNTSTNKLVFQFTEATPNYSTDYIFGKVRSGNKWMLAKYTISKLLSSVTGNSLSWNGGLFFNFKTAFEAMIDKEGGVVSKEVYDKNLSVLQGSLSAVSKENQQIISNADTLITSKTTDTEIFNKKMTQAIDTTVAPGDALKNDTLFTVLSKFQRWINQFKYATGISLSSSYADATKHEYVNNNDTIQTAFGKVQYWLKNILTANTIPSGWQHGSELGTRPDGGFDINAGDNLYTALGKLERNSKEIIGGFGVLPTDVFRVQFDLPDVSYAGQGNGIGGVVVAINNFNESSTNWAPFQYDEAYSTDPYRIKIRSIPSYSDINNIIGFCPVVFDGYSYIHIDSAGGRVQVQRSTIEGAGSLVHSKKAIGIQIMVFFDYTMWAQKLKNKNCTLEFYADVYGYKTPKQTRTGTINPLHLFTIQIKPSVVEAYYDNQQHIVFYISLTSVSS